MNRNVAFQPVRSTLMWLLAACCAGAAEKLAQAMNAAPRHLPTVEAYCRTRMMQGAALIRLVDSKGTTALEDAVAAAQKQCQWHSAGAFSLLANTWSTRADLTGQAELKTHAIEAWTEAAKLDPYGLTFPFRIFETELALGHAEAARKWAARLVELDKLQRLDELKRLSPEQRSEVEAALKQP